MTPDLDIDQLFTRPERTVIGFMRAGLPVYLIAGGADRSIRVRLEAIISNYTSGMRKAAAETKSFGSQVSATAAGNKNMASSFTAGSVAMLAAASAVALGLKHVVESAAEYAGGVRKLSSFTGETAENTSRLAFVLGRFGISVDSTLRPLGTLSKLIEQGGGHLKDFFSDTQIAKFKTQPLIATLLDINDKFHELNTAQERNALLQVAVGRGAIAMRRFFSASREEITAVAAEAERFGLVLTQDNVEAFKKFSDEGRALGQSLKGLEIQFTLALIPAFEKADEFLTTLITHISSAPPEIKTFAGEALLAVTALGLLGSVVGVIGRGLGTLGVGALVGKLAGLATTGIGALSALEGLAAEFGTLATLGGLGAGGVLALAGSLATVAVPAAAAGLAIREWYKWVERKVVVEDLADSLDMMTDSFERNKVAGKSTYTAVLEMRAAFKDLEDQGKLTETAVDRITDGWGLIIEAARKGHAIGPVITALVDGNKDLAASYAATGTAAGDATGEIDANADALIKATHAAYQAAIGFDKLSDSQLGVTNKADLQTMVDQISDASDRLKKLREDAAKNRSYLVRTPDRDAELAHIEADIKKTEGEIDRLNAKAKEAKKSPLSILQEDVKANAKTVRQFTDDLIYLAEHGQEDVAKQLFKMGPKAAAAAHEAAENMKSGKGLGSLPADIATIVDAGKDAIDAKLDEWTTVFGKDGAAAGKAYGDAWSEAAAAAMVLPQPDNFGRMPGDPEYGNDAPLGGTHLPGVSGHNLPGDPSPPAPGGTHLPGVSGGNLPADPSPPPPGRSHHKGGLILHGGGMVLGPDERMIIGQQGEYVSDKDTVRNLGGPAFFERLKAVARMPMSITPASPNGSRSGPTHVTHSKRGGDVYIGELRAHDYHDFRRQAAQDARMKQLVGD